MTRGGLAVGFLMALSLTVTTSEDESNYESFKSQPLQKFWGIPDTTAEIGHLFRYQIPPNAFQGRIGRYKANTDSSFFLPSWLFFHEKTGTFEGVPTMSDLGEHYITVKAYDQNLHDSVNDIFALEVVPRHVDREFHFKKHSCDKLEESTYLYVVLDVSFSKLGPKERIVLLKNFGSFLNVETESLFIGHLSQNSEFLSETALQAGQGNVYMKSDSSSTIVKLQVGCNGKLSKKLVPVMETLKSAAKDGSLAEIVGHPVLGWKLAVESSDDRKRRETENHGFNQIDLNEESNVNAPDPRVVFENTDTPVFQIDPSPTFSVESFSTHRRRRHHRGEYSGDAALREEYSDDNFLPHAPKLSVMATPVYIPPNPSSLYKLKSSDLDSSDIIASSPSVALHSISPSVYFSGYDVTDENETETEKFSTLPETITNESTPTLPSIPLILPTSDVTHETKDFAPKISQRLQKISITAGKILRYPIPEKTFFDFEDGYTRNLKLKLFRSDNNKLIELEEDSWIQINESSQELYALPRGEHVSKWEFVLRATDSDGLFVQDTIEIYVQDHKLKRIVNHVFTAELSAVPSGKWLDWEISLVESISQVLNSNSSLITVLSVAPTNFTWSNDSLSRSVCPPDEIDSIQEVLSGENGLLSRKEGGVFVEKVTLTRKGHCGPKSPEIPRPAENYSPYPRNQVDYFNATVGQLLIFPVPEDTFYDPEDGYTRNLKLSLVYMDRVRIPPNHWLQFDSKNQEFYGIPMQVNIGQNEYHLICEDSGGLSTADSLVVNVLAAPRVMYNVEFSMTLAMDYNTFVDSPKIQRSFVENLASLFGDANTSSIVLSGISPGSTVITWHNKSLPTSICPDSEILQLRQILLGDDERVTPTVSQVMGTKFPVISARLTPTGVCQGALTEISTGGNEPAPNDVTAVSHGEQYIIGLVVPAVVIASILLCAGFIACVLYRRRRTGKMSVGDEDERQTFRSKGIPVIFQDELDERPEPTNKSPVIMKEEKPPLPPPEYQRGPPLATTALLSDSEDSPYQPPPPFTTSRDSARPKPTPTYRMPPPYVPP